VGPVLIAAACATTPPAARPAASRTVGASASPSQSAVAQTSFKLVLFPYIPDSADDNFKSLIQRLEAGFEAQNPNIDLQVIIDVNMNLYDFAPGGTLDTLLGNGAGAAQVVEVDTLLMGTLTANKWVQPVRLSNPGVLPVAWQAATVGGVAYGVPTYLCSNVIYSFSSVAGAANGTNLVALLSAVRPGVTPLVGNYNGSWTLPSFYVDAWADTNGSARIAASYDLPLDQKTMGFFPSIVNSCATDSRNPCLDGSYSDTQAETLFATGKANGFIGYTERLFYIRSANKGAPLPFVMTDPIGGGSHPVMFVDSLVFNPNCTGSCLTTAQAVATYMSSLAVRNLIAFSQDGPQGTLPRYLLQASQGFYVAEPAASDPMYKAYLPIVQAAQPFPNAGFPQARTALNTALNAWFSGGTSSDAAGVVVPRSPRRQERRSHPP
jgi:thiamine pyridinylase